MCRVLIVEDEQIIAADIKYTLLKYEHEVVGIAATGRDAINKIEEFRPDVILMDIMLDGDMDGIETVRYINDRFSIPVIYLTAFSDDATMKKAFETKPEGFLLKPFEEIQLKAVVEMAYHKSTQGLDCFEDKPEDKPSPRHHTVSAM